MCSCGGGVKLFETFVGQFFPLFDKMWKKIIFIKKIIIYRVKLGDALNFNFLRHLEVP